MIPTADRDAFVRGIVESPHDMTTRLVFADYLDDHDDPNWAELIRSGRVIELEPHIPAIYYLDGETILFRLPLGVGGVVRDGFVGEITTTFAALFWDWCQNCRTWPGRPNGHGAGGATQPTHCPTCNTSTGRIPGFAADLFRQHPIVRVDLTDCPIYPSSGNSTFYVGNFGAFPKKYWRRMDNLSTRRIAEQARSDAAVAYGRKLAGLPSLK